MLRTLCLVVIGIVATIADSIYWPSQIIQLGQATPKPLGVTESPNIQNKPVIQNSFLASPMSAEVAHSMKGQEAIEATFSLPKLPNSANCALGFALPGAYNDNNSTWTIFIPNEYSPARLAINMITTAVDPSKDTLADPAPSSFYGTMEVSYPDGDGEGLSIIMNPATVPCSAEIGFFIEGFGDEFNLVWIRELPHSVTTLYLTLCRKSNCPVWFAIASYRLLTQGWEIIL